MSVLTAESLRHTFRMRPHAEQSRVSSGKKNPKGFWNTNKHRFWTPAARNGHHRPLRRFFPGILHESLSTLCHETAVRRPGVRIAESRKRIDDGAKATSLFTPDMPTVT